MATYQELYALRANSALRHRVQIATWIAADGIRAESDATPNHAHRLVWAREVLSFGGGKAEQMFCALLAANNGLTTAQIESASDAAIQTAVNNAVNLVAVG